MKIAAYGIQWIPVDLVNSFLTTKWNLLDFTKQKISFDDIIKQKPEVLISFSPPETLRSIDSVKWLITPGAGINSMPIEKIKEAGQKLINSHANSQSVAEQAWGLLLATTRNLAKYDRLIREINDWPNPSQIMDMNIDLSGKTLGLIGYGSIGQKIVRYCDAFDIETLIFRNNPIENQYHYSELTNFADELDIVMVACPLTDKTKGLISRELINRFSAHTIIVNIARGEIIDEQAMFEALRTGEIWGAGIDTWQNNPYRRQGGNPPSEFTNIDRLVISPHRAFVSSESYALVAKQIAVNLDTIAKGKIPVDLVDLERGY